MLGHSGVRVGDDHCAFQGFGCGDGHLLGRLPTKESAERQRVGWDKHLGPRCAELLGKPGASRGRETLRKGSGFSGGHTEASLEKGWQLSGAGR